MTIHTEFNDAVENRNVLGFVGRIAENYSNATVENPDYADLKNKYDKRFIFGLVFGTLFICTSIILIILTFPLRNVLFLVAGTMVLVLTFIWIFYWGNTLDDPIKNQFSPGNFVYGPFLDEQYKVLVDADKSSPEFRNALNLFQIILSKSYDFYKYGKVVNEARRYIELLDKTMPAINTLKVEVQ